MDPGSQSQGPLVAGLLQVLASLRDCPLWEGYRHGTGPPFLPSFRDLVRPLTLFANVEPRWNDKRRRDGCTSRDENCPHLFFPPEDYFAVLFCKAFPPFAVLSCV